MNSFDLSKDNALFRTNGERKSRGDWLTCKMAESDVYLCVYVLYHVGIFRNIIQAGFS